MVRLARQRPLADSWQEALTRRLRALLRAAPLERFEASKGRRELPLEEQDLRALALRALDLVIEKMGLGAGPTMAELVDALTPLVRSCSRAGDAEAVARLVIDELLNERDRRRAFRESYVALEHGRAVRRQLDFHLLQEHAAPDGSIVLRASTEAINLYAGMLDYPVEDAQIAEEAVLRAQVSRGRIADAVETAKRARLRSIEYEQTVLGYLETSRRDVTQIDWVRDALGLIAAACRHIHERITAEGELLRAIDARIDDADSNAGPQLAGLRDVLDACRARHLRLQQRLIAANQEYLAEHDRQAFRRRPLAPLPDLEAEVFREALELPAGVLADHVDWLLARLQPPRTPLVLHLNAIVGRLLAPRQLDGDEDAQVEIELEHVEAAPPRFSAADAALVDELLAGNGGALSELLQQLRQCGGSNAAQRLLVLRVLLAFEPTERAQLAISRGERILHDPAFAGDDLLVERRKVQDGGSRAN